jgi:hypothetical protein
MKAFVFISKPASLFILLFRLAEEMGATTYDLRQPVLRARNMTGPAKVSKRHFIRNSINIIKDWEVQKGIILIPCAWQIPFW